MAKKLSNDDKLKKQIAEMIFEDEFEGKTAKVLINNELTEPMRNWLKILVARKGGKYRPKDKP